MKFYLLRPQPSNGLERVHDHRLDRLKSNLPRTPRIITSRVASVTSCNSFRHSAAGRPMLPLLQIASVPSPATLNMCKVACGPQTLPSMNTRRNGKLATWCTRLHRLSVAAVASNVQVTGLAGVDNMAATHTLICKTMIIELPNHAANNRQHSGETVDTCNPAAATFPPNAETRCYSV